MSTLWVVFQNNQGKELFAANLPVVPRVGDDVALYGFAYVVHSVIWDFGENDDGPRQVVYVGVK